MNTKKLLLALSLFAGVSAFAQPPIPIGTVVNVNGVVTATQGASGMTVSPGTPIHNGMRFVTTSNASATLRMNSGCQVNLPGSHGVTVLQSMTCPQLTAAVQPVVPVSAQTAFTPGPAIVNGVVIGGAGLIAAGIIRTETEDDEPLSGR